MAPVIAVHSFRRGAGKSTLVANLAASLAAEGRRIAMVDANLEAPSLPWFLGLDPSALTPTLNDVLAGRSPLRAACRDVSGQLGGGGKLFLVPAAADGSFGKHGDADYDLAQLDGALRALAKDLKLDALLIDARSGINEESMMALTVADRVAVVLRLDKQDYQGTAVVLDLARKLDVPDIVLVVNPTPLNYAPQQVAGEVEKTYQCRVASVLPVTDELLSLGGAGLFVVRHPTHPLTKLIGLLAAKLVAA